MKNGRFQKYDLYIGKPELQEIAGFLAIPVLTNFLAMLLCVMPPNAGCDRDKWKLAWAFFYLLARERLSR